MDKAILDGAFARKQIGSKNRLVSWSHRTRFRIGLELGGSLAGRRVLDYGCGDGTYLAMLFDPASGSGLPAGGVGAEVADSLVKSNQERFGGRANLEFIHVRDLAQPEYTGKFDVLVCMEVLEHVLDPDWFLDEFHRLLAPGGCLLLSVPVETGLSVVIKQAVRRINGWRGIGDYPGTTPYGWIELSRAVFAGSTQQIARPVHRNAEGGSFHDHKGFNWRLLRARIRSRFELERVCTSPVPWLPAFVTSQIWFRAKAR